MQFVLPKSADPGHIGEELAQAHAESAGQDQGKRQQQEPDWICLEAGARRRELISGDLVTCSPGWCAWSL